MGTSESGPGGSQSVDRAAALLSLVARAGGVDVPMTRLTEASGLSRPTVRRLMLALIRAGFIEQDPQTRHYALGAESFVIGLQAQRRFNLLDCAIDSLLALCAHSGDSSFLTIRRGSHAVCVHREEGSYPIRTQALQAGDCHPMGVGAGSMAMLSALPDDERDEVLAILGDRLVADYPAYTPATVREHVRLTRQRGWSLNDGLNLANSWAIGVALRGPDGQVIGALSIAALDSRLGAERQAELAGMLQREARLSEARLRRRLGPDTPSHPSPESST